jgi:hypothetical protein
VFAVIFDAKDKFMNAHPVFRLRNPALLMALAAMIPVLSYAAGEVRVDFVAGSVTALDSAGTQRPLSKGAAIGNGDTIRTGEGGRAQVRFSDGAMVSLQPETEFRIDNYQYSGKADGQEKGFFSLLKGGLRTITGWVGRTHQNNYKVTTGVATIGIRGTEYSAALGKSGNELVVNTGEGLIEVCNSAGCMLLASGESGMVSGARAPSRTDSRPQLSPAQPTGSGLVTYSKSEDRNKDGQIGPVSAPLASGSQNYVAVVGAKGSPTTLFNALATSGSVAAIDSSSLLTSFNSSGTYTATKIAGGFSADGIIGWGRWTSGTYTTPTPSTDAVKDMHYVVGVPTSNLTALGGTTATYQLSGFTSPTSTTGLVGGAPSGTLTATFAAGSTSTASLSMSIPIGGITVGINETISVANATASFSLSSTSPVREIRGFFSGANAPYAGLTYKAASGVTEIGDVTGAAVFKR